MNTDWMYEKDVKRVISFTGAGGKTTSIFQLADFFRTLNKRVLVTTTTHMKQEDGLLYDLPSIQRALDQDGYAFAAFPLPPRFTEEGEMRSKAGALPDEILAGAIGLADITLIEADGAKMMPFKVPRAWEPVIHPATTDIVIVVGKDALNKRICDVSFNPEDVVSVLRNSGSTDVTKESILTSDRMMTCIRNTYLTLFKEKFPEIPVRLFVNPKIPGKGILDFPAEVLYDYTAADEKRPVFHLLLLAAGFSRRYGCNKLLDNVEGRPMYRYIYDRLKMISRLGRFPEAGYGQIKFDVDLTVVTQYEEIKKQAESDNIRVIINPDPSRGISSSLQCGLQKLLSEGRMGCGEVLVSFVADQPNLMTDTILRFLAEYNASGKGLGCIAGNGVMGNPCAFSSEYVDEIMQLSGDRGGKRILNAHPEDLFLMEAADENELEDIDFKF